MTARVVGRFAPSPTGPLHFGSVIAAVGSYLNARAQGGHWLVRIDDIDPPREVDGAADEILRTLEALALHWDGAVVYQSRRHEAYGDALEKLWAKDQLFRCDCTRRLLGPGPYPGTCLKRGLSSPEGTAIRLKTEPGSVTIDDQVQGLYEGDLSATSGDFVVQRRDGLYAYHLAVVVDDADSGITEVIRGVDLMPSTLQQVWLQQCLGLGTPGYGHLPVALDDDGNKLSKQTGAEPVQSSRAPEVMSNALKFLGLQLPDDVVDAPAQDQLQYALERWDLAALREMPDKSQSA